jgi:hypothetical protein
VPPTDTPPLPTSTNTPVPPTPTIPSTPTSEPTSTPTPEPTIPLEGVSGLHYPNAAMIEEAYSKFQLENPVAAEQLKFEVRPNLNDPERSPIVFARDPVTNEIILATRMNQQTKEPEWHVAGLRDLADADGLRIGTNLSSPFFSSSKISAHDKIVLQEFNHATLDQFSMFELLSKTGDSLNTAGVLKAIELARANGMTIESGSLLYGKNDLGPDDQHNTPHLKKYYNLAKQSGFLEAIKKVDYHEYRALVDNPEQGDKLIERIIDGLPDPQMREEMREARKELREFIKNYIKLVVTTFKGKVDVWKVINELDINPMADPPDLYIWLIPDYPDIAFQAVREAYPNAYTELSPLDVGIEPGVPLTETWSIGITAPVVERLRGLINAVADMGHEQLPSRLPFSWQERLTYQKKIYGVDIIITERDVDLRNLSGDANQRYEQQAEKYRESIGAALDAGVKYIILWECFGDGDSWLERVPGIGNPNADPTLFYDDGTPKPAYFAIKAELQGRIDTQK